MRRYAIRAYISDRGGDLDDFDIEGIASNEALDYNSEASPRDWASAASLQMRSYFFDGERIMAFGASVRENEAGEDEIIKTYEKLYNRCGY